MLSFSARKFGATIASALRPHASRTPKFTYHSLTLPPKMERKGINGYFFLVRVDTRWHSFEARTCLENSIAWRSIKPPVGQAVSLLPSLERFG